MDNRVQVIARGIDKQSALREAAIIADRNTYDLQFQMSTEQGRRFVWGVLKKLGYGTPIIDINAKVYGAVAKQEVALAIASELKKASREAFYLMESENE